eukprot:m.353447 g.353447  ORF g.353447 m.353447 type:complete len:92 (+) comp16592_c0_seq32:1364-1639(+)
MKGEGVCSDGMVRVVHCSAGWTLWWVQVNLSPASVFGSHSAAEPLLGLRRREFAPVARFARGTISQGTKAAWENFWGQVEQRLNKSFVPSQ